MKILKNVDMPTNIGRTKLGEASLALMDFMKSDDVNMKFECEDKKEANRVYSTVSGTATRYKLNVRVTRSMNDIYVVRKEG